MLCELVVQVKKHLNEMVVAAKVPDVRHEVLPFVRGVH